MAQQRTVAQSLGGGRLNIDDWFAAIKSEIALNAGRIEEALALAEEAVAYAQSIDGKYAQGLAQRIWGQALAALTPARWEEVEAHMAASLQAFEAGEVLPEIARTHRAWGLLCRDNQDLTTARSHLDKARSLFEACGLTNEGERT
jgi:tetratricopeptide (TPR) repeat protein